AAGGVPPDLYVQAGDERGRVEPLIDERPHHRQQERHQQGGGTALACHIPYGNDDFAILERQDVVKVTPYGIRRPTEADGLDARRCKQSTREHRLLDVPRYLEVILQRQ